MVMASHWTFPKKERADEHGDDGTHVVGQTALQHLADGDGEDVQPPVDADEDSTEEDEPYLPLVRQGNFHSVPPPAEQEQRAAEDGRPDDTGGQDIGGIDHAQLLPKKGQQPPDEVACKHQTVLSFHSLSPFFMMVFRIAPFSTSVNRRGAEKQQSHTQDCCFYAFDRFYPIFSISLRRRETMRFSKREM